MSETKPTPLDGLPSPPPKPPVQAPPALAPPAPAPPVQAPPVQAPPAQALAQAQPAPAPPVQALPAQALAQAQPASAPPAPLIQAPLVRTLRSTGKIKDFELQLGKRRLKSIDKENEKNAVTADRIFYDKSDDKNKDRFPMIHAEKYLETLVLQGKIVTLEFTGLDQLNDGFFCYLRRLKVCTNYLKFVRSLRLTGCLHLTDQGVRWITECFPLATDIRVNDCSNLTEISLHAILTQEGKPQTRHLLNVAMRATQVAVLPSMLGDLGITFDMQKCPLLSPMDFQDTGVYRKHLMLHKYMQDKKERFHPLQQYKLVIDSFDLPFSLGQYLVQGEYHQRTAPFKVFNHWKPNDERLEDTLFHVFEITKNDMLLDVVLSPGCIYVLPFILPDTSDGDVWCKLGEEIIARTRIFLNKVLLTTRCVIQFVAIRQHEKPLEDEAKQLEKLVSGVLYMHIKTAMDKHNPSLLSTLEYILRRRWTVSGMDFHRQRALAQLVSRIDALSELEQKFCTKIAVIQANSQQKHTPDLSFLVECQDVLEQRVFPWHSFLDADLRDMVREVPHGLTLLPAQTLMNTHMARYVRSINHRCQHKMDISMVTKLLEILHCRGMLLFYPELRQKPVITDFKWLGELFIALSDINMTSKSKGQGHMEVCCLGDDVPRWTEADLVKIISNVSSDENAKATEVIDWLVKMGLMLRLSCEMITKDSELYVYILSESLPWQPHVSLESVWPADLPEGDLQIDRLYTFYCGCPPRVLPTFFRHISKVSPLLLLWKQGVMGRQGAVEYLVEQLHDWQGYPVLVVNVRAPKPRGYKKEKQSTYKLVTDCMWSVMQTITSILNYVLQTLSVQALDFIPCFSCEPSQNRYLVVNSKDIYGMPVDIAFGSLDRSISCKGLCERRSSKGAMIYKKYDLLGPELQSIVPTHLGIRKDLLVVDKDSIQPFTRCFGCGQCTARGIFCPERRENGHTSRHCGCDGGQLVCTTCGICSRCQAFLARVESTLYPGVSSSCPLVEAAKANQAHFAVAGNLVGTSKASVCRLMNPNWVMSPEVFNIFQIQACGNTHMSFGLLSEQEEFLSWNISRRDPSLRIPSLNIDLKDKRLAGATGCCYQIRLQHPRPDTYYSLAGDKLELEVLINDTTILHVEVESHLVLVPFISTYNISNFMIKTPTKINNSRLGKKEQIDLPDRTSDLFVLEMRLPELEEESYLLMEACPRENETLVLTPAFTESLAGQSVRQDAAKKMTYTVSRDDRNIHPVGFHASRPGAILLYPDSIDNVTGELSFRQITLKDVDLSLVRLVPYNFFSEVQSGGWFLCSRLQASFAVSCCHMDMSSPSKLWINSAQLYAKSRDYLIMSGLYGSYGDALAEIAAVLLPVRMVAKQGGSSSQMVPDTESCYLSPTQQNFFVCRQMMGEYNNMLIFPLCFSKGRARHQFEVHLQHLQGALPTDELFTLEGMMLALGWILELTLTRQLLLPPCEESCKPFKSGKSEEQICHWLRRLLEVMAARLMLTQQDRNDLHMWCKRKAWNVAEKSYKRFLQVIRYAKNTVQETNKTKVTSLTSCPAHLMMARLKLGKKAERRFPNIEDFKGYHKFLSSFVYSKGLDKFPADFYSEFAHLSTIDLSGNDMTVMPVGIGQCKSLQELLLDNNDLCGLPDDLVECRNLTKLSVMNNVRMSALPAWIASLTKLEKLRLSGLLLTELPSNIGDLVNLQELRLTRCCLGSLPNSFKKLQKLDMLYLEGVPFFELTESKEIRQTALNVFLKNNGLDLWFKENPEDYKELVSPFTESPDGLIDHKGVAQINAKIYSTFQRFGYNGDNRRVEKFGGFPPQLFALQNLNLLRMDYQGLTFIPDRISQMKSLKVLRLCYNPFLEKLSANVGTLPLHSLRLNGCPQLKTPPLEIQAKGSKGMMAYMQRLQSGAVMCKRTKLMMVGLGGAGKTSLVRAFTSATNTAELNAVEDITDGIDISTWKVAQDDQSVTFSIWDFAGQTVYYNTHQFFLSNRAVYLLLWNIRLGHEHAGLEFWLNSIAVHAPQAPVFVVGTHLDQVAVSEIPIDEMSHRYPQIVGFHFISAHSGEGVQRLGEEVVKTALHQPYMGESIPQVYLKLEAKVVSSRSQFKVVNYEDLEKWAMECGIFDKSELAQAVQFLHELGVLQHFNSEALQDRVVIDPQWIVDVMACVVSVKDSPIKDGRFYHSDISKVWRSYQDPRLQQWLLKLTEQFDLTFPLPDEQLNLVPCLLPEKQPQFHWPDVDIKAGLRETKIIYTFDYLPAGLFNRGQVRLYQFSDSSVIWKRGSLLRKNGHIAFLTQNKDNELVLKVQGPRPENIVFLVHEVFEGLMAESFQGVRYDYCVPCPECNKMNLRDPYMFTAHKVKRADEMKAPFLQCSRHFHVISLTDLHAIMPPDNSQDYDMHLATAVRGLTDLRKDLTADIFISYCADDLPGGTAGNADMVDPRQIKQDLTDAGFKCYFPAPGGSSSMEEMGIALRDAQMFMAIISDAYVNDEKCHRLFSYARLTLNKPLLMVVVGSGYDWQKSKLGMLISNEVYINMRSASRYMTKMDELKTMASEKQTSSQQNSALYPECFISYSWKNSHRAVQLGSKSCDGGLGSGDPRELKDYLQSCGISCWLDIERVGKTGLFEDIADGLQRAKVIVACVSDQYVQSENCVMEFRFATSILKLPVVLAVVGTSNAWRASEVGMLSVPMPLVSFQHESKMAYKDLLNIVQSHISNDSPKNQDATETSDSHEDDQRKNESFQELYELAQRKFLRQVALYAEKSEELYPRLLLVDFKEMNNGKDEKDVACNEKGQAVDFSNKGFAFKILCEHEQGWHNFSEGIDTGREMGEEQLAQFSPYLARITLLLRHSNSTLLNCASTDQGSNFLSWLEQLPQAAQSDFNEAYQSLRQEVISADTNRSMGQLSRCQLPSGKTIWLCPEHQKMTRVTLLSNDIMLGGSLSHKAGEVNENMVLLHHYIMSPEGTTARKVMHKWEQNVAEEEEEEEMVDKAKRHIKQDNKTKTEVKVMKSSDIKKVNPESKDQNSISSDMNKPRKEKTEIANANPAKDQRKLPINVVKNTQSSHQEEDPVKEVPKRKSKSAITVVDIERVGTERAEQTELPTRSRTEIWDARQDELLKKKLRAAAALTTTQYTRVNSAACLIL